MLYSLEQGEVEQKIIQQCMREKMPLPDRIREAPQLNWGLDLYYSAFWDLSSSRQVGMVEGAIRWIDIQDYCARLSLTEDQSEDMHYYVRMMDSTYLSWREKKVKAKDKRHAQSR